MNRANSLLIPIIVLSVVGFEGVREGLAKTNLQTILVRSTALWLILNTSLFSAYYFAKPAYSAQAAIDFRVGLDVALEVATTMATPAEAIFITQDIPLNYIYVLFWRKIHPYDFQTQADYDVDSEGHFAVHHWQNFYFDTPSLEASATPSFIYILKAEEADPLCKVTPAYQTEAWKVGRCNR